MKYYLYKYQHKIDPYIEFKIITKYKKKKDLKQVLKYHLNEHKQFTLLEKFRYYGNI